MRSCFLRAVLLSAAVVGIILVPALPAHAQCSHLGQQVVCPSGVSNGSTSLNFTNGDILWQTPTGSTTSSPRAGCCPPFTAPTPTAPSATGLSPTTGAGQTAVSNAVRTPSGAVVSDRAPREAERRYQVYRWWQERADAAEREATTAEQEVRSWKYYVNMFQDYLRARPDPLEVSEKIDQLLWEAAYSEHRAREAEYSGDGAGAAAWRGSAEGARLELSRIERVRGAADENVERELARAQEEARAARARANAARRDAEETRRRLLQEARREAEAEAERQRTEQAQPAQSVQQAQQFTVYFTDHATGSEYLRGYLEARPVINQSDAANARPPAPRLP